MIDKAIKYVEKHFSGRSKVWKETQIGILTHFANEQTQTEVNDCAIPDVSNSRENKERIEAYKECFEMFIPTEKWDEATLFLSTYGSGLAKELSKKQI